MSNEAEDKLRQSGKRLAGLLGDFIEAEFENPEDRALVMLAAYEYFETRTAMHRRPGFPWPREAMHRPPGDWPDPDTTS